MSTIFLYFVNLFSCPFLDRTQGSHYYWHSGRFKVSHFLNINFLVFISIIIIIIMSCCQHDISLTLSRHFSLSFIASSRSSGLHPISSQSCCMYVRAGRPAFAWPYVGVHRSTSLMSSSLLLEQCPACLVHLTCIVFVMGGRWPYSWCFVGCCLQDLFNITGSILV